MEKIHALFDLLVDSRRRNNERFVRPQKRSVKVATAVGHTPLGYENPNRKEQRQSRQAPQEMAHVSKRKSQNSEGARGAVGEGEGR